MISKITSFLFNSCFEDRVGREGDVVFLEFLLLELEELGFVGLLHLGPDGEVVVHHPHHEVPHHAGANDDHHGDLEPHIRLGRVSRHCDREGRGVRLPIRVCCCHVHLKGPE